MTEEQIISLALVLVFGAIAGGIASKIMGGKGGFIRCAVLGILGAIVGNWVVTKFSIDFGNGVWWQEMIIDTLGACVILFFGDLLFK